jgi:hypothetical protein
MGANMTRHGIGLALVLTAGGCAAKTGGEPVAASLQSQERTQANSESVASAASGEPAAGAALDESQLCRCTTCVPQTLCETRFRPGAQSERGNCFEESYRVPVEQSCETARSERCCE